LQSCFCIFVPDHIRSRLTEAGEQVTFVLSLAYFAYHDDLQLHLFSSKCHNFILLSKRPTT
jgi:hypothetical protein